MLMRSIVSTPLAPVRPWFRPPLARRGIAGGGPRCFGALWGLRRHRPRSLRLLRDHRRNAIRKNAYKLGREMVWSNGRASICTPSSGAAARRQLSRKLFATKTLDQQRRELPEVRLDHLSRMTDSTGIFQHAILTVPNFAEGYCTDDNARAFILSTLLDELKEEPARVRTLSTTYAAFLNYAFDDKAKRFHNFLSFDCRWLDEKGSEDCHARALWALGVGVGRSSRRSFQIMAGQLFARALPVVTTFTSPRAWAFWPESVSLKTDAVSTATARSVKSAKPSSRGLMDIFDRGLPSGLALV